MTTADTAGASRSRRNDDEDDEEDDDDDTILASVYVAGTVSRSAGSPASTRVGPSCRCVLFSRGGEGGEGEDHHDGRNDMHGEYLYTACNLGSLRCLDPGIACGEASSSVAATAARASSDLPSMLDDDDMHDDDDASPRAAYDDRAARRSSSSAILSKANNATKCKADVDSEDGWEDMDEDEDGDGRRQCRRF